MGSVGLGISAPAGKPAGDPGVWAWAREARVSVTRVRDARRCRRLTGAPYPVVVARASLSFAAANDTPPCPASHPSKRVCWGPPAAPVEGGAPDLVGDF